MGRQQLTKTMTLDDGVDRVLYTADALELAGEDGDKEVAALAKPVAAVVSRGDELIAERRARRRAVVRANALVRRRDVLADAVTAELHTDVITEVRLDREAPLFTRFFPETLSTIVRRSLEGQLPAMKGFARVLKEPETPASLRKKHEKGVAGAVEKGAAAITRREDAFAEQGRTTARVESWKEDANATLLSVEGALLQIAARRRLGTDWVDSFFPAPTATSRKGGGEGDAPADPAKPA